MIKRIAIVIAILAASLLVPYAIAELIDANPGGTIIIKWILGVVMIVSMAGGGALLFFILSGIYHYIKEGEFY